MCSNDVGSAFYQIGKYGIANQLFENALRFLLTNVEDDQSPEVADMLYKIASCHECLCEYNEGKLMLYIPYLIVVFSNPPPPQFH